MSDSIGSTAVRESQVADSVPDARLVPVLLSISKSTRALMGLKLGEMGFHNGQDELLLALDENAPASVSGLADELNVRASTVSKMLDRLIEAGMVARIADIRDARRTMVRISSAGLDARSRLLAMREKLETELVSSLAGEAQSVVGTVSEMAVNLKVRLGRYR